MSARRRLRRDLWPVRTLAVIRRLPAARRRVLELLLAQLLEARP